ncbi:MAG: ABC transporter permease [Verrucomicrobia bacterium]|nr:ABC transporter permease [Verrucomicrobiota bacterium]
MNPIFVLFKKGVLLFTRNKAAVIITFLVPIILIALFGFVFGLYKNVDSGPGGIPLAIVNLSTEPAATDLIAALKLEKSFRIIAETKNADGSMRPLTEADVRAAIHNNHYRFALILPADLVSDDALGIHLKFLSDPRNEIETQMVNGLLQKTIFSRVPQLLGQSLQHHSKKFLGDARFETFNRTIADTVAANYGGDREEIYQRLISGDFGFGSLTSSSKTTTASTAKPGDEKAAGAADIFSRIARIETEQVVGKQVSNPMAARLVGGYAIMFLLFALSGSASSLFEEKRSGIYQRILSAPVRLSHILWSRFLFGLALGTVQVSALFLAGNILFGLDLFSHAIPLLAVILSAAAACTAFGMLLAAVSTTPEMANGLATLLVLLMSAIGGAWFPVSMMPEFIQHFSKLTIVYWSVEGFASVLWAGQSLMEILPTVGILTGIAAGVMALAVWCFKRSAMFD